MSIMKIIAVDERAQKSQSLLIGALIDLIHQRGWEAVNVRDLCTKAGVARSTFYIHFRNKEELLERGFAELQNLTRQTSPSTAMEQTVRLRFVTGIANHIFENRKLFLALIGGNGGSGVREKFRAMLTELILEELQGARASNLAAAHFLAGGFVSLAAHSMMKSAKNIDGFCTQFNRFADVVLQANNPPLPLSKEWRS